VRRELELRQVDVFLPTVLRWCASGIRRRRTDAPLFPGYCFARFDPSDRFRVLNCTGVAAIVSVAGDPAPIPDADIDGIRRLVESDLRYDACPFIHEGCRVEVVRGPLAGVVGRLVRKGGHELLVLSVELVGSAVSVQVHAADVVAA
jgi:transcription antitermination factor NusG